MVFDSDIAVDEWGGLSMEIVNVGCKQRNKHEVEEGF